MYWKYLYDIFTTIDTLELEKLRITVSKVSYEKNESSRYRKLLILGIVGSCFCA